MLLSGLTVENAVLLLIQIDRHSEGDSDGVKKEVIDFIKNNAKQVIVSEHWKQFANSHGDLMTEIMMAMAS